VNEAVLDLGVYVEVLLVLVDALHDGECCVV
jgi:hypothetical protein